MKQPKNSLIALMILLNITLTIFVLLSNSDAEFEKTVSAQSLDSETEQISRKKDEEINVNAIVIEEEEENVVLFDIKGVTSYDSNLPTMPLYFHHSNEEGAWFTYSPTEISEAWDGGYWFVGSQTLKEANIQYLMHNDVVRGVFYDGEYFEIVEVAMVD